MKKMIPLTILFLLTLALPLWAEAQLVDRIVAVVNDEVITQSELEVYLRALYTQYKTEYQGEQLMAMLSQARDKLLNQLIEDKLVFQEAKKSKIEIKEEEVDKMMEDFKKRFKTPQEMDEVMKQEGVTLSTIRDRLYRQAMIQRLQDMEIRSKIVISPNDIDDYYNQHPEEFSQEEAIRVRSITIKKGEEARAKGLTDEEAKEKIQNLRKQITEGADFGKLAQENSEDTRAEQGGLSDWVKRGEMIPVIDSVIFKLKSSEVSDIIETPMGYHLFRLEEHKAGAQYSLEQVREQIFQKIFQQKARQKFEEWMTGLKKEAYLSIR